MAVVGVVVVSNVVMVVGGSDKKNNLTSEFSIHRAVAFVPLSIIVVVFFLLYYLSLSLSVYKPSYLYGIPCV